MLRTIRLRGWLGRKFGKEFRLDVKSAAEAIRALCYMVKGFKQYLSEGEGKDKLFRVVVNGETLTEHEKTMLLQSGDSVIEIVPKFAGSGGKIFGALMFIAGAALTIISLGSSSPFSGYMMAAGIGLMVGGAMSFFMKVPSAVSPQEKNKNDDRSYIFNGPVNTTQQGQPIPVGYGTLRVGSQVISAGLSSAQIGV